MNPNRIIIQQFLAIVDNQIKDQNPVEVIHTLNRLRDAGYTEAAAKSLIAQCVAREILDIMNGGEPFDEQRYIKNLNRLPEEPI